MNYRKVAITTLTIILSFGIGFSLCIVLFKKPISPSLHFSAGNSHPTYFSVHKIRDTWGISVGKNIRVGIIDHGFGIDTFPDLYSGWHDCRVRKKPLAFKTSISHGFLMASTLREISPGAEIYALGINYGQDDTIITELSNAIEWAIQNNIDILTYSHAQLSADNRDELNPILEKAYNSDLLTVFIHNPHPRNILPSRIDPGIHGIDNSSDFDIYPFDYSTIFTSRFSKRGSLVEINEDNAFLSISSTAPVTAGIISIMLSANPVRNRTEVKEVLISTSYNYVNENLSLDRAVDAKAAIEQWISH